MSEKITHFVAVDIIPSAIAYEQTISAAILLTVKLSLNPMAAYLSGLSPSSRRTMRGALEMIAKIVNARESDAVSFPWAELRYQHTQAIHTQLIERYVYSNVNKMMAALSRVLEEGLCCKNLNYIEKPCFQKTNYVATLKIWLMNLIRSITAPFSTFLI